MDQRFERRSFDARTIAHLAIQPHQQAAAASPLTLTGLLLEDQKFAPAPQADQPAAGDGEAAPVQAKATPAPTGKGFVGRPYLLWKDNLELARLVNERLAANRQS